MRHAEHVAILSKALVVSTCVFWRAANAGKVAAVLSMLYTGHEMNVVFGSSIFDVASSCVLFEVVVDNKIALCEIPECALNSICNEYSNILDNFHSCRMFILDCTLDKLCNNENYFSDQIRIYNV